MLSFYAPTFIDESLTMPDKKGRQEPTGRLSGILIGRQFSKSRSGRIKASRIVKSFSWDEDTQEAKVEALAKAIDGMEELPELENNPPISWIPDLVKQALNNQEK